MITPQTLLISTIILAVSSQTRLETTLFPKYLTGSTASPQCEIVGLCLVSSKFFPLTFHKILIYNICYPLSRVKPCFLKHLKTRQPVGPYVKPLMVVHGFHLTKIIKPVFCLKIVQKLNQPLNLYRVKRNAIMVSTVTLSNVQ